MVTLKAKAAHEMFVKMVQEPFKCYQKFRAMRSQKQVNVVLEINKRMLTACNDKVYQLSWDESRPLGHWRNAAVTRWGKIVSALRYKS